MCGDNSIPAPELRKRLQDLMEVDPESSKSRLQLQFEVSGYFMCSIRLQGGKLNCYDRGILHFSPLDGLFNRMAEEFFRLKLLLVESSKSWKIYLGLASYQDL